MTLDTATVTSSAAEKVNKATETETVGIGKTRQETTTSRVKKRK
jgi:hypothetical protein